MCCIGIDFNGGNLIENTTGRSRRSWEGKISMSVVLWDVVTCLVDVCQCVSYIISIWIIK